MISTLGQFLWGNEPVAIAIELGVIWLAVYLVLRFLRGTRGAGVLKGVIVILAALVLSLRFADTSSDTFARLRFVAEALLGTLAIALVVIFQPELRSALVRIGQARWLGGTSAIYREVVTVLDEAVEFLSRNQFGAIIVIERSVALGDIVRTGVPINGEVSARLLESIFWPNSPLHDLAVVIRGDRIVAANVQLPLADATAVPARLGSRHQAALGVALDSDAVVVVVSEQTGEIRIATGGVLGDPIAYDEFAAALRRALETTAPLPVPADDVSPTEADPHGESAIHAAKPASPGTGSTQEAA